MTYFNNIIVLAGPRCVGKSTILNRIAKNIKNDISEQLVNTNLNSWKFYGLNYIDKHPNLKFNNLVLHYDFFRPMMRGLNGYIDDSLYDLLSKFKVVNMVSLWAPKKELIERIKQRIDLKVIPRIQSTTENKSLIIKLNKLNQILRIYQSDSLYSEVYEKWLIYSLGINTNNWLYCNSENTEKFEKIQEINDSLNKFIKI